MTDRNENWLQAENIERIKEYCREILKQADNFDLVQAVQVERILYYKAVKWLREYGKR